MMSRRKIILALFGVGIVGFIVIQIIPMGNFFVSLQRVENPPVVTTFNWGSADVEAIVRRSCYDCHSNETVWPWYSNIAPGSWLITRDVNKGRDVLNFSEETFEGVDVADQVDHIRFHVYSNMPPREYRLLHPDASLNDEQRELIITAFETTLTSINTQDIEQPEGEDMSEMDHSNMDTDGDE